MAMQPGELKVCSVQGAGNFEACPGQSEKSVALRKVP